MKRNIFFSVLFTLYFILFNSCDKIEAPYREPVPVNDFCKTGIEDSVPHRKVLVEDYTGHLCGNCPDAGTYLNDTLKSIYDHCLIIISVHAGFFAGTCPTALACPAGKPPGSFTTDFNSQAGNDWNTFFGITGNPKGMVNRIDYPTAHSKSYSAWAPSIVKELATRAQAKLTITNNYNSLTRNVSVSVTTNILEDISGNFKLQVVLTEDSVIDWQVWYTKNPIFVPDYVHRHVLRDALNTTWGEAIVSGSAAAGTSVTKNYSYVISNKWNVDYCSIVAFVYNDASKEVIQVEEASVR